MKLICLLLICYFGSQVLSLLESNLTKNEFFNKICNNHQIPTIKIKGRNNIEIKLAFTGDTQFARKIQKQIEKDKTSYSVLYSETKDILNQNDAFIFNLETTITDHPSFNRLNKNIERLNIISKPISLQQAFKEINTTLIANLANNHQYDGQIKGFAETIHNCYKFNIQPIGISQYFAWKDNAVPDSYEFPKDFPKNIHELTEDQIKSVPPLKDIIDPSAVILDIDGVKVGITGLSIDFDEYFQQQNKMKEQYGCSMDVAVADYQKFDMLTENTRYNRFYKAPRTKFKKSLTNYWIRRILVDMKRQGAQIFIISLHEKLQYTYCYQFLKLDIQSSSSNKKKVCHFSNQFTQELTTLGADAIISHGPHVVYPFKKTTNPDLFMEYSLGNSIFDSDPLKDLYKDLNNDSFTRMWTGMIQEIIIDKTQLKITKVNIIPTVCAPFTKYRLLTLPIIDNNTKISIENAKWKFNPPMESHNYLQWSYNLSEPTNNFPMYKDYLDGIFEEKQLKNQDGTIKVLNYINERCTKYEKQKKEKFRKIRMEKLKIFEQSLLRINSKAKQIQRPSSFCKINRINLIQIEQI